MTAVLGEAAPRASRMDPRSGHGARALGDGGSRVSGLAAAGRRRSDPVFPVSGGRGRLRPEGRLARMSRPDPLAELGGTDRRRTIDGTVGSRAGNGVGPRQ